MKRERERERERERAKWRPFLSYPINNEKPIFIARVLLVCVTEK